jgi:nucleotide-binding universal stress UspA family protein
MHAALASSPSVAGAVTEGAIVVGYDGSVAGARALHWALREGELHRLPVHVIHVVQRPVGVTLDDTGWFNTDVRALITYQIDEIGVAAGHKPPDVSIREGSVVDALCGCSHQASMIVLGARGQGGFSGLLIGSVGLSVAVHAHCPVIIVRGTEYDPNDGDLAGRPVVVGVDDSPQAAAAIDLALTEAAVRGCTVEAVRAWHAPAGVRDPDEIETAERHALRRLLEQHAAAHPEVEVRAQLVSGSAATRLIEASTRAQLIVVGSRGRGGFTGLLLGSVGQQLLHHAGCPVAIAR